DVDGNGTLDVVLTGNGGPGRLLRNPGGTGHNWIRLGLKGDGKRRNTSAIGARVEVEEGHPVPHREGGGARGDRGQSEPAITVCRGKETKVDAVTVYWPGKNGGKQVVTTDLKINSVRTIEQK